VTFLTGRPDLRGTGFSVADLLGARQLLIGILSEDDPAWLRKPTGPLARHWIADSPYSAAYLIHVGWIINSLITYAEPKSMAVLRRKVRELFRTRDADAFEDRLTELEVGALIAERLSPIYFEPLAGSESGSEADRRKSPDYGFRVPEGSVLLEVTRMRIAFMVDWNRAAGLVTDRMANWVMDKGLRRKIDFYAPIDVSANELASLGSRDVLRDIERHASGVRHLQMSTGDAQIKWTDQAGGVSDSSRESAVQHAGLVEMSYQAVFDDSIGERAIKSMRNSLKGKRSQMTAEAPYILAARIDEFDSASVSHTIMNHFFANPDYSWITGIVLYSPIRVWHEGAAPASLFLHVNENARFPIYDSLRRVLDGTAEIRSAPPRRPRPTIGL
jgi:hypothetical protein